VIIKNKGNVGVAVNDLGFFILKNSELDLRNSPELLSAVYSEDLLTLVSSGQLSLIINGLELGRDVTSRQILESGLSSIQPDRSEVLKPWIQSISTQILHTNYTTEVFVSGGNLRSASYLQDSVRVEPDDSNIQVASVDFIDTENILKITLAVLGFERTYTISINNGAGEVSSEFNTYTPPPWVRLGSLSGNEFSHGHQSTKDIRYLKGMNLTVEEEYLFFRKKSPWQSWVKFAAHSWDGGTTKTAEIVVGVDSGYYAVGIFGDQQSEGDGFQLYEMEIGAYISNNKIYGLYGKTDHYQSVSAIDLTTGYSSGLVKFAFSRNGRAGGFLKVYSVTLENFDDESNLLGEVEIGDFQSPSSQLSLGLVPPNGNSLKVYAHRTRIS